MNTRVCFKSVMLVGLLHVSGVFHIYFHSKFLDDLVLISNDAKFFRIGQVY